MDVLRARVHEVALHKQPLQSSNHSYFKKQGPLSPRALSKWCTCDDARRLQARSANHQRHIATFATSPSPSSPLAQTAASSDFIEADVAIIGAGIIGLTAALALLTAEPGLSVVLLDAKEPCAGFGGATGAGQGYLWLAHRDSSSPVWEMAVRSRALWAEYLKNGGGTVTPSAVEWQLNGSLLIASTAAEVASLKARATMLQHAGVEDATFLTAHQARSLEPSLNIADVGGALTVPGDAQINGRKTAKALLKACRAFGPRFQDLFYEPCEGLATSSTGRVEGVVTPLRTVIARAGVVLAAGAWSGAFLAKHPWANPDWADAILPRRGLLLEMARPEGMPPVQQGMMEVGYTKHYDTVVNRAISSSSSKERGSSGDAVDVTFTATTSASGSLLIGSSREFSGWGVSNGLGHVRDAIMDHATHFLPGLSSVDRSTIDSRVGLRPFSPSGGPLVGAVGEGLFIAAGHEGSGLTLGPASAEILVEYLLGKETHAMSAAAVDALQPPPELKF